MRTRFDEQLDSLNRDIIEMGGLCEATIAAAAKSLVEGDIALAKQVQEYSEKIDEKEREIEATCIKLLLQQHPVASDLRIISSALKMVTDMEHIGDHAADISEMTIFMGTGERLADFSHINKMASETVLMLHWSIEAYVEKDMEKAKAVIAHDDIVDKLFEEAKKDIIALILKNPKDGEEATDLLMVAKYFERIGDHATNIAEWVIYSLQTSACKE